jgi:predicted PhzF superfamily epimerase YddE/YHI9
LVVVHSKKVSSMASIGRMGSYASRFGKAMAQSVAIVDAFAERPFEGNPAAVCIMNEAGDETWMQRVAREMNLSETAFLYPERGDFRLRWFTPTVEVALCGHATLASAHVLWESGRIPAGSSACFRTKSGVLHARREGELIVLDFPATRPEACATPGARPKYVGKNAFDLLVEVGSEATVREIAPNLAALATLPVRGIMVTSRAEDTAFDFVSRFFAPSVGIAEDPVTGSAHCCLGPYWGERLSKTYLVAHQVSHRGGVIRVGLRGDRVDLVGRAVTVLRGELLA